jgi:DNA-binding HxlR family transcriptional regulator
MEPRHSEVATRASRRHAKYDGLDSELPEECRAVGAVLSLVGDKWSVMVIVILGSGSKRFTELKRAIGGISQRMLTLTLRGLERDGLVTRTQFEKIPPRVDYELTALGCSLRQIVEPLDAWARAHLNDMKRARETYDKRNET